MSEVTLGVWLTDFFTKIWAFFNFPVPGFPQMTFADIFLGLIVINLSCWIVDAYVLNDKVERGKFIAGQWAKEYRGKHE